MIDSPAPSAASAPQAPATKKPFYKRVWFIVLAVIIVIVIAVNAGGGRDASSGASSSSAETGAAAGDAVAADDASQESPNPGIGQAAADGKFTFTVNGVDCSMTEIGDQYLGTTAQGQFCIVDVTIANTGDEAQSFFGDNAKLFNAEGQEFSADTAAAIYLPDSSSLYEEINPGNSLNSRVVFDVPAGTVPTSIELHDSAFSGGVTVDLQ